MFHSRRWTIVLVAAVALGLTPRAARAQTNERIYENIEFRAVIPGARAVAMGKAFVGIADDATAAASNPAGLSNLLDPEISVEWSSTNLRQRRMAAVVPVLAKPWTLPFSSWVHEPTFFSLVMPLPNWPGIRDVTVAVFYNSLHRYRSDFDIPNVINGYRLTEGGYAGDTDIRSRALGFAAAAVLGPKISVGGALTVRRLANLTNSRAYDQDTQPSRDRLKSGTRTDDYDTKVGGQVGLLVKPRSGLSIGASYLAGTTFELTTEVFGRFNPDDSPETPHDTPLTLAQIGMAPLQPIEYRIPDRFTAGAGVRLSRHWTLVGDVSHVKYSQRITDKFLIVDFLAQPKTAKLDSSHYMFNDATEVHLGTEHRRNAPFGIVALRGGYFTDPPHQMLFDLSRRNTSAPANGQAVRFNTYRPGTAHGISFGAGVVVQNRLQIDGAVSLSRNAREVVVSSVVRFPR